MKRSLLVGWAGLALVCTLFTACAAVGVPRYTLGPHALDPQTVFTRTVESMRAQGYTLTVIDAPHGRIAAQSHFVDRRRGTATFTVQCYRPDVVQVEVTGAMVHEDPDQLSLPGPLRDEYLSLVMRLGTAIGVGGES